MKHFQILQNVVLYFHVVYEYTEKKKFFFNGMSHNEFGQGLWSTYPAPAH
jgi:hypothetical protein